MKNFTRPFNTIPRLIATVSLILAIFIGGRAEAGSLIDLAIIAKIESNNNPNAVSYRGAKYGRGLYQISEIALLDYNTENRAKIAPTALFDPKKSKMVACWLFEARIPQILRNWHIPVTIDTLLWAYNAGVGRVKQGIMPKETKNYIAKYYRLARLSSQLDRAKDSPSNEPADK